jgi:hypothetical protein
MTRRSALTTGGILIVLVAVVAYLIGTSASSSGPHQESMASGGRAREGVAGSVSRAPTGPHASTAAQLADARSRAGAVDVAATYLRVLYEPGSADAASAVRTLTLPPLTTSLLRARGTAVALLRRLDAGAAGFARGWPLGWRIVSSTPAAVRVAIWTTGMVVSPVEVIAPQWSTTICLLRWSDGRWRVTAAHTAPGPTPPPVGADQATVAAFVDAALSFRAFSDAA